jgi:hypothetical protein
MKEDGIEGLERAVDTFLATGESITPERIRLLIGNFRSMPQFLVTDSDAEQLARRLETRHDVTMSIGSYLKERGFRPWLDSAKASMDTYYWDRYRRLLETKHMSAQVVTTINTVTDRILGFLEDPTKDGPWNRRGMVVGHVQSGKTANYVGLIAKAADAGYRLIVVIAGVHNNLRNQTQKRIDEGFVGRDSARLLSQREERYIGVGRFDTRRRPVTFTNSVKDFSKAMATGVAVPLQNLNEPAVFVIKKNSSTLKNLLEWLREHSASRGGRTVDAPMLLIDDEADNASINVAYSRDEVSRINGQIRELLQMFSRSCYVGYTATPFANIFIDPDTDDIMRGDDLFPRHFIVALDAPTNYFGAERMFDETESVVRHIADNEDLLPVKHAINHHLSGLPASLQDAVRAFVIARAIRLLRGHASAHCSMLVNASRFTGVQAQLRAAIQHLVEDMSSSIRLHAALPDSQALRDPEMAALRRVWETEYRNASPNWREVKSQLHASAAPIKVVEINSRSHGSLNYDEYSETGLTVIAIGGFSLSRGLTLEGLMVSYFLRNSMMYDTLMQMGRWFGYRPDYEDLCRVWMPEEAAGWYAHVSESIEELREELRKMAAADATPEEFGLKVRAHPDTLIVTARNKMGSGERIVVRIGLDNKFVETATLRRDERSLSTNRRVAEDFAHKLVEIGHPPTAARKVKGGWLLRGVPVQPVKTFLAAFMNHPLSFLTETEPVSNYIAAREEGELKTWDVLFTALDGADENTLSDASLGITVNCQMRTAGLRSDANTLRVTNKQRVTSRGIETTGLDSSVIEEAEQEFRKSKGVKSGDKVNYPDRIYREKRTTPLLIVHLLDMREKGVRIGTLPIVAWSISFPKSERTEERVEYVVTTTWLKENFRDDLDDEELDEDDE